MKAYLLIGLLMLGAVLPASAAIYSAGDVNGSGTPLNLGILDGNPSVTTSQITVSGFDGLLSTISVTLNVSGGYNGDLYAYLSYNGTLVTLLNRVGTVEGDAYGFSTSGFNNITLADAGALNIHDVENPLSGTTYAPDGGTLASFIGGSANGTWTLAFADMSAGDVSVLNGWSLDITAVPEPVNVALAIFGGLLAVFGVVRRRSNAASPAQSTS